MCKWAARPQLTHDTSRALRAGTSDVPIRAFATVSVATASGATRSRWKQELLKPEPIGAAKRRALTGTHSQVQHESERAARIAMYRQWLLSQPELVERARRELRGKVLACWCAPLDCHGHVLAEVANS
jgi:hypothetical protein